MLIWTRDALLAGARFNPRRALRKSLKVIAQAHDATRKGEPDHVVRLKAAELTLNMLGVSQAPEGSSDNTRPVSVQIVLAGAKQAQAVKPGIVLNLPLSPVDNRQLALPDAVGQG